MSRFRNKNTGVTVSVADEKDHRFTAAEWEPANAAPKAKEPTVAELRAEIDRRNEGRDEADQLSTDGKKADLIATLEADDAAGGD